MSRTRHIGNRLLEGLRTRLWPVPAVGVVMAVLAGMGLPAADSVVDEHLPSPVASVLFSGGPEAARALLQTIAGSMVTVTSLTFSLTVVTLQLASSQFSPRLLRTFSADRFVQSTLALFLATFVFALTVLRSVRNDTDAGDGFVPEMSMTAAFVLAAASVLALVLFLAHLAREIRPEMAFTRVSAETRATIERVFPPNTGPGDKPALRSPGEAGAAVHAKTTGFLDSVDIDALYRLAADHQATVHITSAPGSFVLAGSQVGQVRAAGTGRSLEMDLGAVTSRAAAALSTGPERTSVQDPGYGFRQLVDIAVRALSPGVNDPTTAVHALGHLSDLLRLLVTRSTGTQRFTDDTGTLRVCLAQPTLAELLALVIEQPLQYGIADPHVRNRLLGVLEEMDQADTTGSHRSAVLVQCSAFRHALNSHPLPASEQEAVLARLAAVETHRRQQQHREDRTKST